MLDFPISIYTNNNTGIYYSCAHSRCLVRHERHKNNSIKHLNHVELFKNWQQQWKINSISLISVPHIKCIEADSVAIKKNLKIFLASNRCCFFCWFTFNADIVIAKIGREGKFCGFSIKKIECGQREKKSWSRNKKKVSVMLLLNH